MNEVPFTSLPTIEATLFVIESTLFEAHLTPLKSHLAIQRLAIDVQGRLPKSSQLIPYLAGFIQDFGAVVDQGRFLNEIQISSVGAWFSEFRSLYVAEQVFASAMDTALLEMLQNRLQTMALQTSCTSVLLYQGQYNGELCQGFEDFSTLSEIGYWRIDRADNRASALRSASKAADIYVVLETGLLLESLTVRLPNWQWQMIEDKAESAALLPEESRNYWIDWLHLLASEREMWRRSASFSRFYKSLHDQVTAQFSVSLDQICPPHVAKSHLKVMTVDDSATSAHAFRLYGGRVFLQDEQWASTHVLPLTESVIPVYCVSFDDQTFVFPVFRAKVIYEVEQEGSFDSEKAVWRYEDGCWRQCSLACSQGPLVAITVDQNDYYLRPNSLSRDYGVVLRSTCLPKKTLNYWRVREQYYDEPRLPDDAFFQSLTVRLKDNAFARHKNRTPVMFQLSWAHGMELYADMVTGIVPYRSVAHLTSGFVYHGGSVLPLIEPEEDQCREDDLVIFVESKGVELAFRGQYSSDKNAVHRLVDADAIVLNWHKDRIRITLNEDGWFLLDQRHTYFFLKQLLEILE